MNIYNTTVPSVLQHIILVMLILRASMCILLIHNGVILCLTLTVQGKWSCLFFDGKTALLSCDSGVLRVQSSRLINGNKPFFLLFWIDSQYFSISIARAACSRIQCTVVEVMFPGLPPAAFQPVAHAGNLQVDSCPIFGRLKGLIIWGTVEAQLFSVWHK